MFENHHRRCTQMPWVMSAIVMLFIATAQAQNFAVTSIDDAVDVTPGDGICADASGNCTLRAAIQEANQLAGADTITLPAGRFQLALPGPGEEAAATGDLDITSDLIITGSGATSTVIDGGGLDRVFDIAPNGVPVSVTINSLAIQNGLTSGAPGGAIRVNLGTVVLNDCSLNGNDTDANGGAINNAGNLTLNRCTLSANTASGNGGGLYNAATVALNNTTLSGNSATSLGGGLYNATTVSALHATIALNSATSGGGLYNAGSATLKSTLLDANTGSNCSGTVSSNGNNLDSGTSCVFSAASDQSNVNPMLGDLTDNGGPTATHALSAGSPAIDKADNTGCPATDQRGVVRPVDGDGDTVAVCDIGAFEATVPADLSISNHHQADCVSLNGQLIYEVSVVNNGPGDASAVTVTDILPEGVTLVSTIPTCSQSGNTLTCALGNLSAGSTATITIDVTADKVAQLTNTASVRAAETDPDTSNNSAEEKTRINCAKGCFIATAAYGSPLAPQLQQLRAFRDRFLTPYPLGNWFVELYYRYSPPLADALRRHNDLRAVVRMGLQPLIVFAKFANEISPTQEGTAP
jgi:uncharacterized repeat protein (TIGR01451 family)/CSLREA domain-containing protein